MQNSNLNKNKSSFIFDLNIPRKINYNSSFNKASTEYKSNEQNKNLNPKKFNKVSNFNPYDIELLKINKDKQSQNGDQAKYNKYKNNILSDAENKENDSRKGNLLIQKKNKYLDVNYKYEQNLINKFNNQNLGLNLGNTKKNIPEYSIKIKNQKNQYFMDLKKAVNNLKIKSTNYSSNGSYNMTECKENYNENNKISIKNNKNNEKFGIFPKALKHLKKYLRLKEKIRNSSSKKKGKENSNKKKTIRVNKSANNIKIPNNKRINLSPKYDLDKANNKNNQINKNENNENISIFKHKSFLKKVLYDFDCCCCGLYFDS